MKRLKPSEIFMSSLPEDEESAILLSQLDELYDSGYLSEDEIAQYHDRIKKGLYGEAEHLLDLMGVGITPERDMQVFGSSEEPVAVSLSTFTAAEDEVTSEETVDVDEIVKSVEDLIDEAL